MRPALALSLVAICAALTGCATFPQLDQTVGDEVRKAPYPQLVPIDALKARIGEDRITPEESAAAQARIAGLRARAARLKRINPDSGT